MFCLPNLSSTVVSPCSPLPWEFSAPIPAEVRGKDGKKDRDKWINNPAIVHQCYSAFEGVIANQRITEPKNGSEGNPPLRMHAFVADIDAPIADDELSKGLERLGEFVPNYLERTLSGQVRLVWLLEQPVSFPNRRFAVEFLQHALGIIRPDLIAVGFDKPAWCEPNRYYTNSCEWAEIDAARRIPFGLLNGWMMAVGEKHAWRKDRGAIDIPLPVVAAELTKKFPTFATLWSGDFVEGAQGPSFWVEGSLSPKSAIVKPTGMFTFAAHAIKPFYSWSDLLGAQFVDKYAAEMLGKAVEGIYHDGTKYWRKDGYGDWKWFAKEDIASHLNVDRGLSTNKDGSAPSEVARAIQYVQNWQSVVGAAPFVFQPTGILTRNGSKFLNTHTRVVMRPADGIALWGPNGQFPFLSAFLDGLLFPDESNPPLPFFLSWLSRFYRGAYEFNLESGQNAFLLGPPAVGKTFLNQGLLPALMGGSAEAEGYLLGRTDFNSDLFEVGFWTIDDNSATVDAVTHKKFSAMVKKMAANTTFQYHAKFRIPCSVDWRGRVFVTANDDEQSATIVPDLSISNLDKVMLWRTVAKPPVHFPSRRECERIIRDEGPWLARFLLEYQIPEQCLGSSRFGVLSYHDKTLLQTAEQSSRGAAFTEIIVDWSERYFAEHAVEYWEGTGYQFLKALHVDDLAREAGLRSLSPTYVGTQLAALKAKGVLKMEANSVKQTRVWRIYRPEGVTVQPPAKPQVNSKTFAK